MISREMGCWNSRVASQDAVSRCRDRRRCMKQLLQRRREFAAAHSLYLRSIRATGAALLQFANAESEHLMPPPFSLSPSPQPSPQAPNSPGLQSFPSSAHSCASSVLSPPPHLPSPSSSNWDLWSVFDLLVQSSSQSATEDKSEDAVAISGHSKDAASELAVSNVNKDLLDIVKEINQCFVQAAEAGNRVSRIVGASDLSTEQGKTCGYGKNSIPLHWYWRSNSKISENEVGIPSSNHSSTLEKLYDWDKKLYLEVKNAGMVREELEKKMTLLRKQKGKEMDDVRVEKTDTEIERLQSRMNLASQSIQKAISAIIELRETELFPQLLELVTGLMGMWRSMHECHQLQAHIIEQLKHLDCAQGKLAQPTNNMQHQAALLLELEVNHWYFAFCSLVKSQREYINAYISWLRLSLFHSHHNSAISKSHTNSDIYSLCQEWQLAIDRIPDKVASEGIKSFSAAIHAIVVQQSEERKQMIKSEAASKEVEKRAEELRSLVSKYGPLSAVEGHSGIAAPRIRVLGKQAKVEATKAKAEEEKMKYGESIGATRATTLNSLLTRFPCVFLTMTNFSSECMQAFEAVHEHHMNLDRLRLEV